MQLGCFAPTCAICEHAHSCKHSWCNFVSTPSSAPSPATPRVPAYSSEHGVHAVTHCWCLLTSPRAHAAMGSLHRQICSMHTGALITPRGPVSFRVCCGPLASVESWDSLGQGVPAGKGTSFSLRGFEALAPITNTYQLQN